MKTNRRNQGLSVAMIAALLAATVLGGCGGGNSDSGTTAAATSAAQAETTAAAETQAETTAAESQAETAAAETQAQAAESDLAAQVRGNTDPSPELIEQVNNTLDDDSYVTDSHGLGSDYSVYDGRFDGVTLDIWMPDLFGASKVYPDMSQHPVFQRISQLTGIKLNFITPTIGEEKSEFNLMISGGELPDIIINGIGNYSGGVSAALNDGLILDLAPYEDKLPNYMTLLNNGTEAQRKVAVTDDKSRPCIYLIGSAEPYIPDSFCIKTKAMEDAGWTEVPETIDEWHSFLTDCKNAGYDIPLEFYPTKSGFLPYSSIADAYGVFGGLFINDEGKVAYGPVQDGAEDYLQTMHQWYEEGLFDPDFATADSSYMNSMISSDSTAAAFTSASSFVTLTSTDSNYEDVTFAMFPSLNKGDQVKISSYYTGVVTSYTAVLTTQCENVDAALAFLDFCFTKIGWCVNQFGSYGDCYLIDEEGVPYFPEDSLIYTDEEAKQYQNTKYRLQNWIGYRRAGDAPGDDPLSTVHVYEEGKAYKDVGLPPLSLTPEETSMIADIATNISMIQQEYYTKIIMGQLPLSAVQEFRDKAAEMGLDTYVSVHQDAYDRFLAR